MVTQAHYVPRRGDLVWLDMNPQTGHEQAGRRPVAVLSPVAYNSKVGLMLCCPVTSRIKAYPFEVVLSGDAGVEGAILSDQIKNLDWKARRAEYIGKLDNTTLSEVLEKINLLLAPE